MIHSTSGSLVKLLPMRTIRPVLPQRRTRRAVLLKDDEVEPERTI